MYLKGEVLQTGAQGVLPHLPHVVNGDLSHSAVVCHLGRCDKPGLRMLLHSASKYRKEHHWSRKREAFGAWLAKHTPWL